MITLASDFGTPYPAAMKGVILQRADTKLIDVAHDFPRQNVQAAAFWLREVLPYFPPAVHLVVVDPGVGTDRKALAVRVGEHALVGPDNGVLLPAARALADQQADAKPSSEDTPIEVFEIQYGETESTTFHGRDVFAPAAADVHEAGVESLETIDRIAPIEDYVDLRFPEPKINDADETAIGEVLVVDGFGNVVTNLPGELLADTDRATVNDQTVPVTDAYANFPAGQRLLTVGSHGNVELAVNQGRGDEAFGLSVGDELRLDI